LPADAGGDEIAASIKSNKILISVHAKSQKNKLKKEQQFSI